jgi:hypothetical protein
MISIIPKVTCVIGVIGVFKGYDGKWLWFILVSDEGEEVDKDIIYNYDCNDNIESINDAKDDDNDDDSDDDDGVII